MNIKGIIKGTVFSFIMTSVFLVTAAALCRFGATNERYASLIVFGGAMLGIFIGALGAAKTAQSKRLPNSIFVSLLFSLLVILASVLINGSFSLHTRTITLIGSAFGAGILGALFGK